MTPAAARAAPPVTDHDARDSVWLGVAFCLAFWCAAIVTVIAIVT